MRHVSIFIDEPRALDVFAYRGSIFVLTFDGHVLTYAVSEIAADLQAEHGTAGLVAAYALFSSKGIGASPEMKSIWKRTAIKGSTTLVLRSGPIAESRTPIDASAYLDMRVYYNQLFLATDLGTFGVRLDAGGSLTDSVTELERLVGEPTEHLSTGMGAIGASLGSEGLAVFTDVGARDRGSQTRIECRSLRSSIGWGRTVNYPTHDSFEVLSSQVTEDRSGRRKLVAVAQPEDRSRTTVQSLSDSYVVWESGRLLVADPSGIASLGRAAPTSQRHAIANASGVEQPLWLGVTGNRCVVTELSDQITVARGNQRARLHSGPAISVRTFGGSHRYRRLVAATVQGGLLLSAAFVENEDVG